METMNMVMTVLFLMVLCVDSVYELGKNKVK